MRSWQVTLILTMFFIAVAGAAGIGWWYARESPAYQGPIILITVDGLSVAGTGPSVGDPVETAAAASRPGLEALKADSVVFDRAYTHAPHVLSAHASLLSGRLPFEHGVRDDAGFALATETRMLAEMLRNRGFATGAAVSSVVLRSDTHVSRGFSFFEQPAVDAVSALASSSVVPAGSTGIAGNSDAADAPADDVTLAAAEQWVRRQEGQRYFLMLQVDAAQADQAVTRLSALLREQGLYDGAAIVLVGVRGDESVRLDDATLHVPLWIKQPQREGAGRHIESPVQHIDLLPTILDLVRAPIPGDLQGRSLRAILGGEDGRLDSQPIYSESLAAAYRVSGNPVFALTVNDFRYLHGGSEQLTRLDTEARDASESDIPTVAPDVASMRATLDRLLAGHALPAAARIPARDRDLLARIGYLGGLSRALGDANLTIEQQDAILAVHQQAALLLGSGRPAVALRALQSLAREYPTLAAIHLQLGTLAGELGRTREATAAFRAASALRPDAPEIPRALATLLARTGQMADAHTQAELAIELARPLGAAEIALSEEVAARVALAAEDVEAALRHADAVQASNPALPMHAFVQGLLLLNAAAYSEAAPVLEKAVNVARQHDARLEGLHLALGDALKQLQQLPEAEAAYRRELEEYPRSLSAYQGLVLTLGESGRDADVELVIAQMLAAAPTPDGYATAARLWTTLGHRARAEAVRSDAQARFRMDAAQARAVRVTAQ